MVRILRQQDLKSLPAGRHADSGPTGVRGLYLSVNASGARSWVLRIVLKGKRREIGLGSLNDTPMSIARQRAMAMRQAIWAGEDVLEERRRQRVADGRTFEVAAKEAWEALRPSHRNEKASQQWMTTVETYAYPVLKDVSVGKVTAELITEAIKPIWLAKPETARRVLQRVGHVLESERATGRFTAASPLPAARKLLGRQPKQNAQHFAALDLDAMPGFMKRLRELKSPSALALELAILTVARTRPVRLLENAHLNLETKVWTAPAGTMKTGQAHRTPLSARALEVIRAGAAFNDKHVFPGGKEKAPLSDMAMLECLRGLAPGFTVHGFRSVFVDWCRRNGIDFDIQEAALAHQEQNKIRRAYARGDLLDERRPVMDRWAVFLDGKEKQAALKS